MSDLAPDIAPARPAANGADIIPSAAGGTRRTTGVHQRRSAETFANVVGVLMRDPGFKNMRLTDLEWLLLPAVRCGQCRLAFSRVKQADVSGGTDKTAKAFGVPAAAVLWASVSPDIDKRLSYDLNSPLRLGPAEWTTGEILWLVAAAGNPSALQALLKQLQTTVFKDRAVKLRARGSDGKVVLRALQPIP